MAIETDQYQKAMEEEAAAIVEYLTSPNTDDEALSKFKTKLSKLEPALRLNWNDIAEKLHPIL